MPMVAHIIRRIALLILNISTRLGWVISSMPWLLFSQENGPFPTVNMAGWDHGLVQAGRRKRKFPPAPLHQTGVQIRLFIVYQVTTPSTLSPLPATQRVMVCLWHTAGENTMKIIPHKDLWRHSLHFRVLVSYDSSTCLLYKFNKAL
jgi:hypothetical protein